MNDLPFRTLLYRYFFFGWLFRDVGPGNLFERAAARRYNRQQARFLPVYLMRWLFLGLAFYALGGFGELTVLSEGGARVLYALSAGCVGFGVTIVTAWVGLVHGAEELS